MDGALIYLNGGEDLSVPLSKVEGAGGKILLPKLPLAATALWHILQIPKETELHCIQWNEVGRW